MHSIDLEKYDLRTDLIIEKDIKDLEKNQYEENNIIVEDIVNNNEKYITISFKDVTDQDNYDNVLKIFTKELKNILNYCKIDQNKSFLIIGLGNENIVADSLGSETLNNIIVTRHLYELNDYDSSYRNVCILKPNVMGVTGIESFDIIESVIKKIKPDCVLAIDSLCASNISRINKTIQITTKGISPGSGIGNNKKELSKKTLKVPVIAIGIPTVVDSIVIVSDTIKNLIKKIGYMKKNINNNIDKFKLVNKINYQKENIILTNEEKQSILGYIGLLDENDLKKLIWEVLSPIDANMIVTTKEIDFVMEKLSKLIGTGINLSLHQ